MDSETPLASNDRDGGRVVLWDADLARKSPLFWPLHAAFASLASVARLAGAGESEAETFPQPEHIDAALSPLAGIRFERQKPVPRRRRQARDPSSMYDARIAREGCVPTRPGSWHDLMNALVWATFPLAKRALHERQHSLVVPAQPGESAHRSRELDALALLDEGGVLVIAPEGRRPASEDDLEQAVTSGAAKALVFGHAIYEGMVLGRPAPLASVVCVDGGRTGEAGLKDSLEAADKALAAVVADRTQITDPRAMLRLRVRDWSR